MPNLVPCLWHSDFHKAFEEAALASTAHSAAEQKVNDLLAEARSHETAAAKARAELSEKVLELEAHRLGNHDQGKEVCPLLTAPVSDKRGMATVWVYCDQGHSQNPCRCCQWVAL